MDCALTMFTGTMGNLASVAATPIATAFAKIVAPVINIVAPAWNT